MARGLGGSVGKKGDNAQPTIRSGMWTLHEHYELLLTTGWPGIVPFDIEYVVIAGGGGSNGQGGGGAGGYRSNVSGESSGGGSNAEVSLEVFSGTFYNVSIGAGGGSVGLGSDTTFHTITSIGGGYGGANGGCGGGANGGNYGTYTGGSGTADQGYDGGDGSTANAPWDCPWAVSDARCVIRGAGGGGAGAVGMDGYAGDYSGTSSTGGAGVASSITGSSVTRAGGGGGAGLTNGAGGGGAANLGGGGNNGSGGSGVVILRYPSTFTINNADNGLTMSTATVGSNKVTQITAGTGQIQFT